MTTAAVRPRDPTDADSEITYVDDIGKFAIGNPAHASSCSADRSVLEPGKIYWDH
jgi:hypothetical protein